MKTLLTFTLSLLSLTVFGATPSFSSFDTNNFSTTGNKITITNVPYSVLSGVPSTIPIVTNLQNQAVIQSTNAFVFPGGLNPIGYNEIRVNGTNYSDLRTACFAATILSNPVVILSAGTFPMTGPTFTNVVQIYGRGDCSVIVDMVTNHLNGIVNYCPMFVLTNNFILNGCHVAWGFPSSNQCVVGSVDTITPQWTNALIKEVSTDSGNIGAFVYVAVGPQSGSSLLIQNCVINHGVYGLNLAASGFSVSIDHSVFNGVPLITSDTLGLCYNIYVSATVIFNIKNCQIAVNDTNAINIYCSTSGSKLSFLFSTMTNWNNGVLAQTNISHKLTVAGGGSISMDAYTLANMSAGDYGIRATATAYKPTHLISPEFQNSFYYSVATNSVTTNVCSGKVMMLAASSAYYITNSLVTTNSIVIVHPNLVDVTATILVPSVTAGLITVTPNVAPTANLPFSWELLNPYK